MNWLGVRVMIGTLDELHFLRAQAGRLRVLLLAGLAGEAEIGLLRHLLPGHLEARDGRTAVLAVVAVAASETTLLHTAGRTSAHGVGLGTAALLGLAYAVLCVFVAVRAVALDGLGKLHRRFSEKRSIYKPLGGVSILDWSSTVFK